MNSIKERETINIDNINKIYFDLKTAQALANVSNQTLYTYANDTSNNINMIKFKGKNYLHREDIEYIKNEVYTARAIRKSTSVIINKEATEEDVALELEDDSRDEIIAELNSKIEELIKTNNSLAEENKKLLNTNLNLMSSIAELRQELGELREFKKNTNNLNEIIKTLNREKDELYKNQINTLVKANNDMINKFDKMIDSQNAFQVMLAQKEQTSQKLIEDRNQRFLTKLFKKK